jgi:hypothetical protein
VVFVERIDELLPQTLRPSSQTPTEQKQPEPETVTTGGEASFESGEAHA